MSDAQSQRPAPRGRGSARGGRGASSLGGSTRGGRSSGSTRTNGDSLETSKTSDIPIEEQGEVGKLKTKYASQLALLKDLFPAWTDEDLVIPLEETSGDVQQAANMISEGHATQWGEVKKKSKDRARSKTPAVTTSDATQSGRGGSTRGGRGSYEGSRGTRGRGNAERGTSRGGRGGLTSTQSRPSANGVAAKEDVAATANAWGDNSNAGAPSWGANATETEEEKPRDESDWDTNAGGAAWGAEPKPAPTVPTGGWGTAEGSISEAVKEVLPVAPMSASEKPASKSSVIPAGSKGTWASMFKAPPAPAPVVQKAPVAPKPEPVVSAPVVTAPPPTIEEPTPATTKEDEIASLPPPPPAVPSSVPRSPLVTPALPEIVTPKITEPEITSSTPSEQQAIIDRPPTPPDITNTSAVEAPVAEHTDQLTESNLEKIEDLAPPRPSSTTAGTISTPVPAATPSRGLPPLHRAPGSRSGIRRILDQQEAVVMPRDHSIDRAAVQFGSMGLNGDLDEPDDNDASEEPETVTRPQQHSPIGQPKTSLPSSNIGQTQSAIAAPSHSPFSSVQTLHDALPAPRGAPGLAPPSHQNQMQLNTIAQQVPTASQSGQASQPLHPSQTNQSYQSQSLPNQSKFTGPEHSKFEPFGQQLGQSQASHSQSPYGYPSHSQHQQGQQGSGASSGMPSDYGNYYGAEPGRTTYQGYYNQAPYGQQHQQSQHQEQGLSQPRSNSGLGQSSTTTETQSSTTGTSQQNLSRYTPATQSVESGHASPSPGLANAQQAQQHPQYPMHPSYYPQYYNYMNQMYNQYPGFQNGKGFYGQPHQGFMSPGAYEHATSPAGFAGFGGPSSQGRESSLSDYGRNSTTQSHTQQPQHSAAGFNNSAMPDYMSARQQQPLSGIGSQQPMGGLGGSGQTQQISHSDDSLKPFGESKTPSGPSAIPSGAPGRPPSTSGMSGQQIGQNQGPSPSQSSQPPMGAGIGGYPHHFQSQSLHGGMSGGAGGAGSLGSQGSNQNSGYNMYGGFGGYPSQYGSQNSGRQTGGGNWGYGH